jgi:predicted DCC family thiol-disulfide oxidoreductase YuxK
VKIIDRLQNVSVAIYDGYCVICNQTRRIVTALDWLHRIEFLNIHDWNTVNSRYPSLDYEIAMGQIHVVTPDGQLHGGFDGVRRMMRDLPLGFPFWMAFHLPGMTWLGEKVYRFIARHRYQINKFFGAPVCENGTCKIHT